VPAFLWGGRKREKERRREERKREVNNWVLVSRVGLKVK